MDARQQPLAGMEPEASRLHHLFFAVLPGPRAADAAVCLAQVLIARHGLQARVRAQRLHATLLSLGWEGTLSSERVAWARAAAQRVVAPAFTLRFDRVLSFRGAPHRKRPCVLCGPPGAQGGFMALHEALHTALWPAAPVPGTTPHMTLCYSHKPVPEAPVPPIAWTVCSFALLHNLRGSPGPYECLGTWALAGPHELSK